MVRLWPVLAPVVVTMTTGSPARTDGTVRRPPVALNKTLSCWWRVLENIHAPGRLDATACIIRWSPLAFFTS